MKTDYGYLVVVESGTYKLLFLFVTLIPEISNAIVIKEHVYCEFAFPLVKKGSIWL